MNETRVPTLKWGHRGFPDNSPGAWGARLIAPDDVLGDRQDAVGAYAHILDRLNAGLLHEMQALLRELHESYWPVTDQFCPFPTWERPMKPNESNDIVLFMDHELCVIANTNGSHGYVYLTAFLFPKED